MSAVGFTGALDGRPRDMIYFTVLALRSTATWTAEIAYHSQNRLK